MKHRILLGLVAFFISFTAFGKADISGTILDKKSSEPLGFASVSLADASTGKTLTIGAMADEQGHFLITNVPDGKYIVNISILGCVPQEREISVADTPINLGVIYLAEDAKLLQEVVVTAEKSQLALSADKKVFNVSTNISSSGASADELLSALPSVDVNSDGEVSLRGNSDVLVWINGKEMGMNSDNRAQFLRQIPADAVKEIEVMTNPSSKHSTEGTAGIINIILKEDSRHGYFGEAEATVDTHGTANLNFNINYNEGKFQSFAGIGIKTRHYPAGMYSLRTYSSGDFLSSDSHSKKHENSIFLRLGTNYNLTNNDLFYLSAIGTLGHTYGHTDTYHVSDLPGQWATNNVSLSDKGDTRGANLMLGYKHIFASQHFLDMNVSYNIWLGPNDTRSHELSKGEADESLWQTQHQDVKISNWEAALDYSIPLFSELILEAGYKGNYNHENSPASYASGAREDELKPLDNLYNRFKYNTDISALYFNFNGSHQDVSFSAGLRAELWQIRTRSLGYGQTDSDVSLFKKNGFDLFPSASIGYKFADSNEVKLNYSRRIRRPFGPQLNTFENISDPAEVHLGNPLILPEYSNSLELTYLKNWSRHMLSVSGYMRLNSDMISHVSFLAPMASNPDIETMYYGHANVGNMTNIGVEIVSRNNLWQVLTLTTSINLYNSHLKAWNTEYPMHEELYTIHGNKQNRLVWEGRITASVKLPWDITLQASARYNSRRITAQGSLEPNWDMEAGLRKVLGNWSFSLICKDIFDSKKSEDILYGNGYTQSISKWSEGRTLRLAISYNFGKTHSHSHEHHNHIDTGGYGEEHVH